MATTATLDYLLNVVGPTTQATLAAAIAAIPFDQTLSKTFGLRLTSDITSMPAGQVKREIILKLNQPPFLPTVHNGPVQTVPTVGNVGYQPVFRSTSTDDTAGGAGVQSITVSFLDPTGGAHMETIATAGQNYVAMVATNAWTITDVVPAAVGSFGAQKGTLIFWDTSQIRLCPSPTEQPNVMLPFDPKYLSQGYRLTQKAAPMLDFGQLPSAKHMYNARVVGAVPNSFFTLFPTAATQVQALAELQSQALILGVGPVLTSAPVLA